MASYYNGFEFRTHLLARWAAFFDLASWEWKVNPAPVQDWQPDFHVAFACDHSACAGGHDLLISVLPIDSFDGLMGHPALMHRFIVRDELDRTRASAGAIFGRSPEATFWQMSHGDGGGIDTVTSWVDNASSLWSKAADQVPLKVMGN